MRAAAVAVLVLLQLAGWTSARLLTADSKNSTSVRDQPAGNRKPLIGILSQPCHDCPGKSYVAAGYVKWIEAAGGRAVPIRFYDSDDELRRLFNSINGLIFPGGLTWCWLDAPYVIAARKLFNMAIEANDNGEVFPIHGTCLGHQLLHILTSNVSRNYLLVDTDSVSDATTLELTPAYKDSRVLGNFPEDLVAKVQDSNLNITLQNHMYGILPEFYDRWPILKENINILSTTKDRNGTEYVSTVEFKKYPFTGTQWHPEKPASEFSLDEIPHTLDAIRVGQHFANYFIDMARKSTHKPESREEELAMLIYNYSPVFSARYETYGDDNYDGPDITYYFDQKDPFPPGPGGDDGGDGDAPPAVASHTIRSKEEKPRSFWATQHGQF